MGYRLYMASRNMFEVLKRDDSDTEEDKPKKQTKHEQRADDKQKRESTGDRVQKTDFHAGKDHGKVAKDSFGGDGKRTHERHSGTGANAFNKAEKKGGAGGGGKGNWGGDKDEIKNELVGKDGEKKEVVEAEPEEPEVPVQSLDDYMKENQMNLEFKMEGVDQVKNQTVTAEKGFKVMQPKEKDWVEAEQKNKNIDNVATKSKGHQIQGVGEQTGYKGKGHGHQAKPVKGKKASELRTDDFPALG